MVEHYANKKEQLTEREIGNWLEFYGIKNFTINEDLTVDIKGDVYIRNKDITRIPIQFGKVSGNFVCENNQLTSLKGVPYEVGNFFDCSNNKLETLEFAPLKVGGSFDCSNNKLVDLKFAPKEIGNEFIVLEISYVMDNEFRTINNNFKNNIYNELDPKEILKYLEAENLAQRLQTELPKQDDISRINNIDIDKLHAEILERNKTVIIPDTYITEIARPKEEVKQVQEIKQAQTPEVSQITTPVQQTNPRRMKL